MVLVPTLVQFTPVQFVRGRLMGSSIYLSIFAFASVYTCACAYAYACIVSRRRSRRRLVVDLGHVARFDGCGMGWDGNYGRGSELSFLPSYLYHHYYVLSLSLSLSLSRMDG